MDLQLLGLAAAFGLAASTGLNTTLPLLIVGGLARVGLIGLATPYDALASDITLGGLLVLAVLEIVGDKVAGADSIVQAIQLPLSAAAGAILFASQTSTVTWMSPEVAILAGLLTSGTVHTARAAVRPVVTATMPVVGNAAMSAIEDVGALSLVALALVVPVLAGLAAVALIVLAVLAASRVARSGARLFGRVRGVKV